MDPLSDVLSLLKPQSYMAGALDAGGNWSLTFPEHDGINWYAIISGECWLSLEGMSEAVRIKQGDCFLLPRGKPFRLANDLTLSPFDAVTVFSPPLNGGIATYNGGGSLFGIGGYFSFNSQHANILLETLPPVVHIKKDGDKATLRFYMDQLMQELREPQPGSFLVAQNLAYMLLVKSLRLCLAEGVHGGVGWLFALADTQMSIVINCMHADPSHRWTLQELAKRVGMCKSSLSFKFKNTVGVTPMEYLTRWRMLKAGDRLANSHDSVSVIATSLGYDSESAFSTAFKRVMGCSPRNYSRGRSSTSNPLYIDG